MSVNSRASRLSAAGNVKVNFPVKFSRQFLSKFLGGSSYPAFPRVKFNKEHVHHVSAYYVGVLDWSPQFPKSAGEPGRLLLLGSSVKEPIVPWFSGQGGSAYGHGEEQKPLTCFVKKDAAEYEYIGEYKFGPTFRKLTDEEVRKHVTKMAWENWTKGISGNEWGATLLRKLKVVKPSSGGESRKCSAKEIKQLFERPDVDGAKLCFYWQV
jgi:hypothetical protein